MLMSVRGESVYGSESEICKEAVAVYGKEQQLLMFFEEVGELMQAISKDKRGFGDRANIAEEICDVEIMIEQLKYIYGCHREVNKFKNKKIVRLLGRIDEVKKGAKR